MGAVHGVTSANYIKEVEGGKNGAKGEVLRHL
jgi:hypothetical protein